MNKTAFVTLFFSLICGYSQCLLAQQVDRPYYSDNSHTVYVAKRTVLYIPSDVDAKRIIKERNATDWIGYTIGSLQFMSKTKVKTDSNIPVIGFIKSESTLENYDCYIVEYNGQLYLLPKESCNDNTLIDSKNKEIHDYYESLKKDIENLSNEYFISVKQKAESASNELSALILRKDIIIDSIAQAKISSKETEMLANYKEWEAQLDASGKKAAKTLLIQNSKLSEPNSAAGCDYVMAFTNTSNKTIKYLDWSGNVYNAVDDIVTCEIRGTKLIQGRYTGPAKSNEMQYAIWNTVIYNWSAKEMRLTGITIIYTDGTKTNLSAKEIKSIIGAPNKALTQLQIDNICRSAQSEVEIKINNLEKIKDCLRFPTAAKSSTFELFEPEREIYKQIELLNKRFTLLCEKNKLPVWYAPDNVKSLTNGNLHIR